MTIEIFMWVMSVALIPFIGWVVHQTWSIKKLVEMHENPGKTGFGTIGLDELPAGVKHIKHSLDEIKDRQIVFIRHVDKIAVDQVQTINRLDDLKEVISQNTAAMRELVTLIRIMDARVKSGSSK